MNVYTRTQIQSWDRFTIMTEPIASIDLMERAARALFHWINFKFQDTNQSFVCICGTGNNGGDGLALSRLLIEAGYKVMVIIFEHKELSEDCNINLNRLKQSGVEVSTISNAGELPSLSDELIIIDALYGTGLTRPLEANCAAMVDYVNTLPNQVISIDLPSGLPADGLAANDSVVCANFTLTFQVPKFSLFMSEHEHFTGEWIVLDIGLHPGFEQIERTPYTYLDKKLIDFFKPEPRAKFSHKGQFGHAVLAGGSIGMMGAVTMAAGACLRSGVGLCTLAVPDECVSIVQGAVPEAMCIAQSQWMQHQFYTGKTAVGVGMGWVASDYYGKLLQWMISNISAPILIDATGLNLLAQNLDWLTLRPAGAVTILTPHIGEFTRLTGKSANSVERLEKAKRLASQFQVFIVLKGAYTQVITPGGLVYFNCTGNAGMAKGGSGDVLAGLITGMLAQGMLPAVACLLGVYIHGLAGDLAAQKLTQQGMTAMDIVHMLPKAWKSIF